MKKKRDHFLTVLFILILFAGLSLLLYPSISNYWNSFHSTQAIANYTEEVANLDHQEYDDLWDAARKYNEELSRHGTAYRLTDEQTQQYETLLNVSGLGIMGSIEIPEIDVNLPIYHGTDESVLQVAVGHLEWSSLPIGGDGTHCVLSGHRGLPNLDQLEKGDTFLLRILDEVLTYEVDQILIVEPQETAALQIEHGKDYCTLITCTPYGINTHRLLVRGHRIDTLQEASAIRIIADAIQIEPLLVTPIVALPILLVLLMILLRPRKPRNYGGDIDEVL